MPQEGSEFRALPEDQEVRVALEFKPIWRAMTKMVCGAVDVTLVVLRIWKGLELDRAADLAGYAEWKLESVQSRSFIGFIRILLGLSEFRTDMSEVA